MTVDEYKQLKAFVSQDGIFLAAIWTLSFACFVGQFSFPLLGTISSVLALVSPFFALKRMRRYRDWGLGGTISFKRALVYGVLLFFYASLLFALIQYVYFQFIDNGYLVQQYNLMMEGKSMQELLKAYNLKQQMEQSLEMLGQMTAIEKAINILPFNITVGFLLSVPMAMAVMRTTANKQVNNQEQE